MNNISLIVTDLDSTLVRSDGSVSEYTKYVFQRVRDSGVLIAFATLRSEEMCKRITEQVFPDILITSGGALSRCGNDIICNATIERDIVCGIIKRCAELGVSLASIESDAGCRDIRPADFVGTECANVYKIGICTDDYHVPGIIAAEFPSVTADSFGAGYRWHLIRSRDASKDAALRVVCSSLGVSLNEVLAFGDDYGDIGMIRDAGVGVAVQKAREEVKAAADYICGDCDSDGVSVWITENLQFRKD